MSNAAYAFCVAIDELITTATVRIDGETKPTIVTQQQYEFDRSEIALSLLVAIKRSGDAARDEIGSLAKLDYIAVSSIGLIDNWAYRVENVVRPTWQGCPDFPIDLAAMIGTAIPDLRTEFFKERRLEIINDCTACVIGEHAEGLWRDHVGTVSNELRDAFAYIRVGEGVNVGIMIGKFPWRGGLHPEMGHIIAPHRRQAEKRNERFHGICPVHGDCLEGTISAPALLERWNEDSLANLWRRHPTAKKAVAENVAYLASVITMMLAPRAIFVGGSVVDNDIVDKACTEFTKLLGGYPNYGAMKEIEKFLRLATLGADANITGLMLLAQRRYRDSIRVGNL